VSDILVNAITPVVAAIGWSPVFISIVFVAIAGNAAEYASAITAAAKDRMDLALQISMGSAAQIAQFVGPVLILLSLLFASPLNLIFSPYELIAIALSTFIANFVVLDGESNWLEGLQLIAAYLIIAGGFFFFK
jgi:Ca2+:H+ antiporter